MIISEKFTCVNLVEPHQPVIAIDGHNLSKLDPHNFDLKPYHIFCNWISRNIWWKWCHMCDIPGHRSKLNVNPRCAHSYHAHYDGPKFLLVTVTQDLGQQISPERYIKPARTKIINCVTARTNAIKLGHQIKTDLQTTNQLIRSELERMQSSPGTKLKQTFRQLISWFVLS